ncbi:dimethylarginine dimethylaminohydrolase family protein [Methylocapsa acidiphila]|uniref:dimethylarginine dimethylaminohydrolase family protein n=1 Tax=Methylocapsa acidiphila TaxID=133552 RepID=UPI00047C409E|nr:arginine deiminase-related protein [Methylocapsa acidiphila]
MTLHSQTILMCPPNHFEVAYVINPWMEGQIAKTDDDLAHRQWDDLCNAVGQYAKLALEPPQRDLPDIVFTANAGLVLGEKVIVSRFRSRERRGEEPHHRAWFEESGFEILDWPQDVPFEGAGDALFDRGQDLLWVGHGFRSDAAVPALLEKLLGRKTAALNLVDPRFYHLDTCLCPLEGGYLLYFPAAFDEKSRALIEALTPQGKRIAVEEADAMKFCCNAVDLGGHVFMNDASETLQTHLRSAGFAPIVTPLSEFMKAGGGAKCLTLKLVET